MLDALADPSTSLAAFGYRLAPGARGGGLWASAVEAGARSRAAWLELPWGDQGLSLTTATLRRLGGVKAVPLLEDVDLVLRARAAGRVRVLAADAETSPRRFDALGACRANAATALVLLWWHFGATPGQLFSMYYG